MPVYAKSSDPKLVWFLDFLNSVVRIESPRLVAGQRLSRPDDRKLEKTGNWVRKEVSPEGLRSGAAAIAGHIVTLLNLASPWTNDDERALADLRSDEGPVRITTQRAAAFEFASRLAEQFLVQFEHDELGRLVIHRIEGPLLPNPTFLLLNDAMNVLAYLVERGFLRRLKSCVGEENPLYRGAEPRRCLIWFEKRPNSKHHSEACARRTEFKKNKPRYYARQTARERKRREEESEHYAKRQLSKAVRNPVRSLLLGNPRDVPALNSGHGCKHSVPSGHS